MKQLPQTFIGHIISSATLQEADLIDASLSFLDCVAKQCNVVRKMRAIREEVESLHKYDVNYAFCGYRFEDDDANEDGLTSRERACYIWVEDIFELLSDIAPRGATFSSHEGDGALFGFWAYCDGCGAQIEEPRQMCECCKERYYDED